MDQVNECKMAMDIDRNLLFSNLKREKIVNKREDIREVICVVITSSNYFCNMGTEEVSVIGFDMLYDVLRYSSKDVTLFKKLLKKPFDMYLFDEKPRETISEIETDNFVITYNEIEY